MNCRARPAMIGTRFQATVEALVDRDAIVQLLVTLPARQRAAIVLRYFDDLATADVARVLGCRLGTARSLISRGLASLRQALPSDPENRS